VSETLTDANGNRWTLIPETCPQCARLREEVEQLKALRRGQEKAHQDVLAVVSRLHEDVKAELATERAAREKAEKALRELNDAALLIQAVNEGEDMTEDEIAAAEKRYAAAWQAARAPLSPHAGRMDERAV
jgi:hypothetical protein